MLTDGAIEKECNDRGVDANGKSQSELIAALASSSSSSAAKRLTLTDGKSYSSSSKSKSLKVEVTVDSLPANLHSMSLPRLRAVAASHGIVVDSSCSSSDIIDLLENGLAASSDNAATDPFLIANGEKNSCTKPKATSTGRQQVITLDDDSSDSDYEED